MRCELCNKIEEYLYPINDLNICSDCFCNGKYINKVKCKKCNKIKELENVMEWIGGSICMDCFDEDDELEVIEALKNFTE